MRCALEVATLEDLFAVVIGVDKALQGHAAFSEPAKKTGGGADNKYA